MLHTPTISKFAALALALTLTGCARQESSGDAAAANVGGGVQGHGILGALRPKADPTMVERIRQEEAARQEQMALQQQQQDQQMTETDGQGRILPKVSMEPIAPPAEEVASAGAGMTVSSADSGAYTPSSSGAVPQTSPVAATPATASYGSYNSPQVPAPPSGALGGGLVPPPPAVTLSTTAQTTVANAPGADPNNPYANPYGNPYANPYGNPYANPYMNPYGIPYPQQAQPQGDGAPQRPALFGSGKSRPREESEEDAGAREKAKKFANFVPITPTGMEARSPYKQRDDLRLLWKGAIGSSQLGAWSSRDPNIAAALSRIDVGLPGESTKGSFSVGQRQVDAVFKPAFVDKRIQGQLRKTQSDMVQSYYRYLYSYNRFALSQQTVAARKQEVEVASSHAEQQRAAADLSQAQSEADSAKEDMRSAQLELSAVSGAGAARAIIQKVSGVAPSVESLAQAQPAQEAAPQGGFNMLGSVGSFFGFNKKKTEEAQPPAQESPKVAKADKKNDKAGQSKDKSQGKEKTKDVKESKAKKGGKVEVAQGDLEPAPSKSESPGAAAQAEAAAAADGITFELKGKNISARKSVLNVSIRNTSENAFSFSPEDISVQEGTQKLSEAAMRAEFDSTSVAPNQEVKGTITIFGRPWNDRLTISLSDGQRSIHMKR
jgi:hypothetical protein